MHAGAITASEQLVGTWALVAWEVVEGDAKPRPLPGVRGHLAYTPDGYVFALLAGPASPADGFPGLLAYCARFELAAGKVVHHVLESSAAGWAGTVLVRYATLEGERLLLRTPPVREQAASVHRLVWARVVR